MRLNFFNGHGWRDLIALWVGRNDLVLFRNGPLAGLVAVCAGFGLDAPNRGARCWRYRWRPFGLYVYP